MVTKAAIGVAILGDCTHHWMIDSPNGPTSLGRCRDCDEVREFPNSCEDTIRVNNSDIFDGRKPRGSRNAGQSRVAAYDDDVERAVRTMYWR